jgi:hypothetical protein
LNTLHDRLAAALKAVAASNEKITATDAAMAKLRAAIDEVPQHQGALNALAIADAAAFETWARAGDDTAPPAIDAQAHDDARKALVEAQAKASAATAALGRIERARTEAFARGDAAQKAILPLASQIILAARVPEVLAEVETLRVRLRHKSAVADSAHTLLIEIAETLPKGSEESREVYVLAEKLGAQLRATYELPQVDDAAVRASWLTEINAAIPVANETEK